MRSGESIGGLLLGDPLGAGAFGLVFAAHRDGVDVAVKVVEDPPAADRARLEREAEVLARLAHPGVVEVVESGWEEGRFFLVMRRATGTPLGAWIRQPPLPAEAALDLVAQVADALAAAHAAGVFHRDIKPANVVVDPAGRAVVVDWGAAALTDAATLTLAGERPPATAAYAPPEWFEGRAEPGPADVYALGVVLHELLTGRRAFPVASVTDLAARKQAPIADDPRVERLTHPDPTARPSMAAIRDELWPHRGGFVGGIEADATVAPPSTATPASPDRHQLGRYTLLEEIGRGGMGVVWRARDPELDRVVALKITPLSPAWEERLRREARAVARLDHPGIVRLLDVGREGDQAFLVMELVDGADLRAVMAQRGSVHPRRAATWVLEAARALAHAHAHGLVHRDVKPANLLVEPVSDGQDRLRLTDFGLVTDVRAESMRLTQTGQILGTPVYMAPEQARGDLAAIGPATDVYALGVILFELLSGELPFEGGHPAQVLHRLLHEAPRSLRSLAPHVPPDLRKIATKAMARDPSDRYATASELAADLDRYLRDEPVLATDPSVWRRARWWVRRNRRVLSAVAIALLAVAAVAGGWWGVSAVARIQAEAGREAAAASWLERFEARLEDGEDTESLRAAFELFAAQPDSEGTAAVPRGWLRWGSYLQDRGETGDARNALAQSYATAVDDEGRATALMALARLERAANRWTELASILALHRQMGVPEDPVRARLEAELALAERRVPASHTSIEAAPALVALLHGRRSEAASSPLWLDFDGDGTAEPYRIDGEALVPLERSPALTDAGPGLPVGWVSGVTMFAIPSAGRLAARGTSAMDLKVVELTEQSPVERASWPGAEIGDAVAEDIDGDGRIDVILGMGHYARELALLRPDGDGWAKLAPDPGFNASASEVTGLEVADLDGDGTRELVVGTGGWGTADVRVYHLRGDVLDLVARDKIGIVSDLTVLPRPDGGSDIVVVRRDMWPLPSLFGPESPTGTPLGIYRLRFDGGQLRRVGTVPAGRTCDRVVGGDVDGDGVWELLASCRTSQLFVFRQVGDDLAGGVLRDVELGHGRPQDLDGDGDHEVVVRLTGEERVHVLGIGDERVPAVPIDVPAAQEPPAGLGPLRERWQRAEELHALGLTESAAERLEALAVLAPEAHTAALARFRAAELTEQVAAKTWVDRLLQAAALYEGAASEPALRHDALVGAARCYEAALQPGDAAARLEQLPASDPARDRIDDLRADQMQPWSVPLGSTADGFEILAPLQVRHGTDGTLDLDLVASDREHLARLPVSWDGGAFGLEVEMEVIAAEWDAQISVILTSDEHHVEWPQPGLELGGHGGAGTTRLSLAVGPWANRTSEHDPMERPHRLTIRDDEWPRRGVMRLDIAGMREEGLRYVSRGRTPRSFPPGSYKLVILGGSQRLTARIHRLRLWGVQPRVEQRADGAAARTALAAGRPAEALPALDALPDGLERRVLTVAALDDLDRRAETARAIDDLVRSTDPELDAALVRLLRLRGDRVGPAIEASLGHQRWLSLFWSAYETVVAMHPDSDVALDGLTRVLGDIDETAFGDDVALPLAVLVARAGAWRRRGRLALAEDHAARAMVLARRTGPAAIAGVELERARLAMARGQHDEALERLAGALDNATAREVVADQVAVAAAFAPLRELPGWEVVVRARSLGSSTE